MNLEDMLKDHKKGLNTSDICATRFLIVMIKRKNS